MTTFFPPQLHLIPDPPKQIFVRTRLTEEALEQLFNERQIIGVVGTRQISSYGREITTTLTSGLVARGFVIVSGLARGVDTVAHQTTLDLGGKTIAVLGTDVDRIYPQTNKQLATDIITSGGVIMSEIPPGQVVNKWTFAARNRLISGVAVAVLITEAAMKSGSLITARMALEQGKEVLVVPGPINSEVSKGTNFLISQGATPVTSVADIIAALS